MSGHDASAARWTARGDDDACCPKVLVEYFDDSVYEARKNYFKPPVQVTLIQHGGDDAGDSGENTDCCALLHTQMSDMISDPYSSRQRSRSASRAAQSLWFDLLDVLSTTSV